MKTIIGVDAAPNNIGVSVICEKLISCRLFSRDRSDNKKNDLVLHKNIKDLASIDYLVHGACYHIAGYVYDRETKIGIEVPVFHQNPQTAMMVGMMLACFRNHLEKMGIDFSSVLIINPSWIKEGLKIPKMRKSKEFNQKDATHISIYKLYPQLLKMNLSEHELDAMAVAHHLIDPTNRRIKLK